MTKAIIFGFLIGICSGNALPHFIKGITKENYPCLWGNSPISNLIAGWLFINITSILIFFGNCKAHPEVEFFSCSIGLLLIGLFHAGPGAFGRKNK